MGVAEQMPDFDVNEAYEECLGADSEDWLMALFEPLAGEDRAPGKAGGVEEHLLPEETPSVWRVRDFRNGHRAETGAGKAGAEPIGGRRRHARAACPFGRRVAIVGAGGAPRERRRIWTRCHRERPSAIG
jgi:hypothetical protein